MNQRYRFERSGKVNINWAVVVVFLMDNQRIVKARVRRQHKLKNKCKTVKMATTNHHVEDWVEKQKYVGSFSPRANHIVSNKLNMP